MENEKKYAAWLRRQGRSKSTTESYSNSLKLYFESGYKWTFEDACLWKESEMQRVKPATVNIRIHAINAYCQFTHVRWRLKPVKVQNQQYVEHQLTMTQYEKLLKCLLEDGQLRWWAAIKVLACTGVRISEALQIKREDLKTGYVDVCGKGSKYRRIWFSSSLRQEVLSTFKEDGLLLPYSDGVIRKRLHAFARKYKLPKEPLHPHEFRAFYARQVYDKCKDLKFLQDLLGHSDIKTTVRYLRKTSKGISRRISKIVTWWDITGQVLSFGYQGSEDINKRSNGVLIRYNESNQRYYPTVNEIALWISFYLSIQSSLINPTAKEDIPSFCSVEALIRIFWDIRGESYFAILENSPPKKAFTTNGNLPRYTALTEKNAYGYYYVIFDSSYVVPALKENSPIETQLKGLIRISWDITGRTGIVLNSPVSTDMGGAFDYLYLNHTGLTGIDYDQRSASIIITSSRVVPSKDEVLPSSSAFVLLIRLSWDIRGEYRFLIGHYADDYKKSGVFGSPSPIERSPNSPNNVRANYEYMTIKFSNSFVAPCSGEEQPLTQSLFVLQRIVWDISGELRGLIGNGTQSTGAFIRYTYEDWSVTSGTSGYKIDGSFKSSRVAPAVNDQPENIPIVQAVSLLIRVIWPTLILVLRKEYFL